MVWTCTNTFQFSVSSGYHLHRGLEAKLEGESSRRLEEQGVWKMLWQMKVAPVFKMFL